jgi:hypothetical protein
MPENYTEYLRQVKSLLIVTSLQKRDDIKAIQLIKGFSKDLIWEPFDDLMINTNVWNYVVNDQRYDPKLVFCHPDVILSNPTTSFYYRGLCGLSLKAVKDYFGSVESLEAGNVRARFNPSKAKNMARTYNMFICSIIANSTDWTLENGYRTVVATLGITLDGKMRNKIGEIAEQRIRAMILEWLIDNHLVADHKINKRDISENIPNPIKLQNDIVMEFSSEPDISFSQSGILLAVIEIKGGIDPAGALERYGAATKSFQHSVGVSPRCKNFYLGAVFTPELERRIRDDRLVEKTFNVIKILDDPSFRDDFFRELFHHTLRLT